MLQPTDVIRACVAGKLKRRNNPLTQNGLSALMVWTWPCKSAGNKDVKAAQKGRLALTAPENGVNLQRLSFENAMPQFLVSRTSRARRICATQMHESIPPSCGHPTLRVEIALDNALDLFRTSSSRQECLRAARPKVLWRPCCRLSSTKACASCSLFTPKRQPAWVLVGPPRPKFLPGRNARSQSLCKDSDMKSFALNFTCGSLAAVPKRHEIRLCLRCLQCHSIHLPPS